MWHGKWPLLQALWVSPCYPGHPSNSSGSPKPSLDPVVIRGSSIYDLARTLDPVLAHGHVYPQGPKPESWWCPQFWHLPAPLILGLAESSEGSHVVLIRETCGFYLQPLPSQRRQRTGHLGESVFPGHLSKEQGTTGLCDSHHFWSPPPYLTTSRKYLTDKCVHICLLAIPPSDGFPCWWRNAIQASQNQTVLICLLGSLACRPKIRHFYTLLVGAQNGSTLPWREIRSKLTTLLVFSHF